MVCTACNSVGFKSVHGQENFSPFWKIDCTKETGRDLNPHGKKLFVLRALLETGFSLSEMTCRIQGSFTQDTKHLIS